GAPFGAQPALKAQDAFGNDSTNGLPTSLPVTLSLTSGTGPLLGVASRDIASGQVSFSGLELDIAGTNKQLTASATGLSSALSSVFSVSAGAADHLTIQAQPSASATAGVVFAQQPVLRIEDAFGNLVSTNNTEVVTATRNAGTGV